MKKLEIQKHNQTHMETWLFSIISGENVLFLL